MASIYFNKEIALAEGRFISPRVSVQHIAPTYNLHVIQQTTLGPALEKLYFLYETRDKQAGVKLVKALLQTSTQKAKEVGI